MAQPLGALSPTESQDQLESKEKEAVTEELPVITPPPAAKRPSVLRWWRLDPRTSSDPPKDPEKGDLKRKERKLVLIGPIYAGCGAGLAACKYTLSAPLPHILTNNLDFALSGVSVLLEEYALDRNPTRFALCATLPIIFCVSIVRPPLPFLVFITNFAT